MDTIPTIIGKSGSYSYFCGFSFLFSTPITVQKWILFLIIRIIDEKILKKLDLIPSFWVVIPQHLRFLFRCYWKLSWNSRCGYKSIGFTRIVSKSGYYSYYPPFESRFIRAGMLTRWVMKRRNARLLREGSPEPKTSLRLGGAVSSPAGISLQICLNLPLSRVKITFPGLETAYNS